MKSPHAPFRPSLQILEPREVPATLLTESFETAKPPFLPNGMAEWHNNTNGAFVTTKLTAATGAIALSSVGAATTQSRFWSQMAQPSDIAVSLKVRSDGPASVQVLARGSNLNTANTSYLAAIVAPGARQIQLVEVIGGTTKVLGTVTSPGVSGPWLTVTLTARGTEAGVTVQRADTGLFLNANGAWQSGTVDAIKTAVSLASATGFVGLGRAAGGTGMTFVDDLTVSDLPPQIVTQNFDTATTGQLPANWQKWTSDTTTGFATSTARALSGTGGLAVTGASPTAARTWYATPQSANVQASAALYADSLIPASLVVRGSNLNTTTPSYYGLSVVRGLEVKLDRVVNGATTTLATLKSREYVSQKWVRVTLTADGNQLRAVVFRTDTGTWLSPEGEWLDFPQPGIEVKDSTLGAGGLVGVARAASSAGTVTFDDLEIKALSGVSGPAITLNAPTQGSGYVGDVKFQVSGSTTARRVEFRLDGLLQSVSAILPAEYELDTTMIPNGTHELVVRAIDAAGNATSTTLSFKVNNPASAALPTRPEIARHYDHIRIAQLAYYGNPMGAFEQARLKDSVDLVIPNEAYLGTINTVAPSTPQFVYTNLSNLYGELLTNWLNYADRTGASREQAFYHVTKPTPHAYSSQSAVPVTFLWSAYRGSAATPKTGQTDVTGETRGGRIKGTVFGGAGEAVALGYVEKFRELNFTMTRGAGAGWQAAYEYPIAVSADGTPTAWRTLTLKTDTTGGLTKTGQVTFDPPADWVTSTYGASTTRYFYLRVRTTVGTAAMAPEARTILGRDYVGARGSDFGVIPAYDYAADKDGDGYLNDTEYAARVSGKDARFVYESRLFYPNYGQMRFATNPSSAAVHRWMAEYHTALLAKNPLADGFFLDNSNGRLPIAGISVVEPTTTYSQNFASMVASVWRAIAPKMVISNTAGGLADSTPIAAASTGVFEEYVLRATGANWAAVEDIAGLVQSRLSAANPSPYVILDTHQGDFATNDPRLQAATLAYYYLVGDPNRTMLMFFGGNGPAAAWSKTWIPAVSANIGQPKGAMTVCTTGADPQNAALTYKVYRREYDNAIVLYKPLSYSLGKGTGTLDAATATTHDLGGNYRVLNPDGTLGPVVNRITLRNGEGATLMKA